MRYLERLIEKEIQDLVNGIGAIALAGPKAVGKTETAKRFAATIREFDDAAVQSIVQADPRRMLMGETPILLDDWQRYPAVWDQVRRALRAQLD